MIKGTSLILVVTGIVLVIRPPFLFHDEPNMDEDGIGSNTNTPTSFHNNPLGIHDSYYYIGAISAVANMIFRSIQLIAFKYCDGSGNINDNSNPNGSLENIAGIFNSNKNILGMMPHPERMIDEVISNKDGINLFSSLLN